MKAEQFLNYIRTIYKHAYLNHPESNGSRLYQCATNLLYPNGMPQIALIGHYIFEEAQSYNNTLPNKIDLDDLEKYLKSICVNFKK